MFDAYEFVFNGESSTMYGLMIYDFGGRGQEEVAFGNKAKIVETRTNNRIQPIHFGVNYHEKPLEFKLVFGSEKPLDRFDLEVISTWLTGHQNYKWLQICQPDMEHVQFRCFITSLTPLVHGWLPVAFEATVRCDCPYAYSFPFQYSYQIKGTTSILFRNNSSTREYLKPVLSIQPTPGVSAIKIINKSDNNREFQLNNLPASDLNICVDNANGIILELNHGYNLYGGFNLNFFRLLQGDNELEVSGDGFITVSGRFLCNVAG